MTRPSLSQRVVQRIGPVPRTLEEVAEWFPEVPRGDVQDALIILRQRRFAGQTPERKWYRTVAGDGYAEGLKA